MPRDADTLPLILLPLFDIIFAIAELSPFFAIAAICHYAAAATLPLRVIPMPFDVARCMPPKSFHFHA